MKALLGLLTLCCTALPLRAEFCPPDSPQSGNMRDIMLAYMSNTDWRQGDFLPYVAHLDKQTAKPQDWFYDSWLLLMFSGAPSGGAYYNGTSNKADWDFYLDLMFKADQNLAALNACIEEVGKQLGDPNRVSPIIIMIPHLDTKTTAFGDVDGDGVAEDPSQDAGRLKAFTWLVDEFLRRYRPEQYPHLKLWGFYWMLEGVYKMDEAVVRATAEHVHARGLGLHWIPWFQAGGYTRTREFGFDFVVMQPNFAFINTPPGAVVPDEGRLTQNANLCRANGLGVEMELDTGTDLNPAKRLNLQLYLNHGVDELDGYMNGAVRAYYQANDYIARLFRSDIPECNQLYDDLYRFHKGTYKRRAVSLCEGVAATLNGKSAAELTDGVWLCREGQEARVLSGRSPATVQLDLGAAQIVGDLRVHVAGKGEGEPVAPQALRVATSTDGATWQPAAEAPCPRLERIGEWEAGFVLLPFTPRFARHVRVSLEGSADRTLGVGEVVMFPAPHILQGAPCAITGDLVAGTPAGASVALTDGRLAASPDSPGAVRFAGSGGAVRVQLPESYLLATALAHARWNPQGQAPNVRVATYEGETETSRSELMSVPGKGEGWLEAPLGDARADAIRFEVSGGAEVAWDELQVRRTPNLVLGKPYRLAPGFDSQYPDSGGAELTDGGLCEKGFGDGRTVGWYDRPVTVTLDLGAERQLDSVRLHTEGGGYAAVWYPTELQAWGSSDAREWRLLAAGDGAKTVTATEMVGEETMELAWLRLAFAPTVVRYLRLRMAPHGWTMLSEVEALSGETNVAQGCVYYLAPQPKSETNYADDGIRLTDGDLSRPSDGWAKVVGWSEGEPEVTVDMLQPTNVSLVRAHVLGGGNGGVYYPRRVLVSTSLDGAEWTEVGSAQDPPAEPGNTGLVTYMDVGFPAREARYIRLRLERKGWGMVDEVEVY